jgi:hypothetical protein
LWRRTANQLFSSSGGMSRMFFAASALSMALLAATTA